MQGALVTGGSAFNVKAKSLRLGNFTENEVRSLLHEHTEETGQKFDEESLRLLWEFTEGQPWLVNALAFETCFEMEEGRDRSKEITRDMIVQAKENLILRRETHLDRLADKLKEPQVRTVVEPIMTGSPEPGRMLDDDIQYVEDLGLIRRKPHLAVSNAIYKEIIPRMLVAATQDILPFDSKWYVRADGRLDAYKLISAFQEFFGPVRLVRNSPLEGG